MFQFTVYKSEDLPSIYCTRIPVFHTSLSVTSLSHPPTLPRFSTLILPTLCYML